MKPEWTALLKKEKDEFSMWKKYVKLLQEETKNRYPTQEVLVVLDEAYRNNYHNDSRCDGCTVVSELDWPGEKHPACVGHDYLYMSGWYSRLYCDMWLYSATVQMGNRWRGFLRFIGVRLFGYHAWKKHRDREKK